MFPAFLLNKSIIHFVFHPIFVKIRSILGLILDSTGLAKPKVHVEVR